MKKITLLLFFVLTCSISFVQAQAWYVYDGTSVADELSGWSASTDHLGPNGSETVVDDTIISGNSYFEFLNCDEFETGTTKATKYYKHSFSGNSTAITIVSRMKGILVDSLTGEYAFQIETANGVVRSVVDIVTDNNMLKEEKGDAADTVLSADLSQWQIYRITLDDDSVNVYLNEGTTPVMAGYGAAKTDNHVRFGDAGSARVAGCVDWFVIDTTGAYAPGAGLAIPDSLSLATGEPVIPAWYVCDGTTVPDELDGWSASSDHLGPNGSELIIDDPAIDGNSYFEFLNCDEFETGTTKATKYYKHSFSGTSTAITIVSRMKGILVDSLTGEYAFQIETANGVVRSVVDIVTDNNMLKEEKGDAADTVLSADLSQWQIYRITLDDDAVNVYLNEESTPVMSGLGAAKTDNHVRFGDAGSARVAGCVDWFVIDTTGAYAPGTGAVIPDSLSLDFGAPAAVLVTDIELSALATTIDIGKTTQVSETITPWDATDKTVSWSVSADTIATVSETGLVTGVAVGVVDVIATANDGSGVADTISITVKEPDPIVPAWYVYDGSDIPYNLDGWSASSSKPGPNMSETVEDDPDIDGNKIFQYIQPDAFMADGTTKASQYYKHNFSGTSTAITIVGRMRGILIDSISGEYAFQIESANGVVRSVLDIVTEGNKLKEEKGDAGEVAVDADLSYWQLYRITLDNDAVKVYMNEDETPVMSGLGSAKTDNHVRFGDAGGARIAGCVDWFIIDTTGAYAPGAGAVIPDSLSTDFGSPVVVLSDDATLKSLAVSVGALTPAFDAATLSYTVEVPNETTEVVVTAEANHDSATVAGAGTITLAGVITDVTVTVTAEDKSTQNYTIVITKLSGIGESLNSVPVKVYPNPVVSNVTFGVTLVEAENVAISIVDASGRVVKTSNHTLNMGENNVSMDVSNIQTGLYFYTIKTKNGLNAGRIVKIK